MNFLSIDCTTENASFFVKAKSKTFIRNLQSDKFNNDSLVKEIINFFNDNNLKFEDISQIFVNQGPGNFSILRTSIAIAKGISISKNIKLSGYNTFLWMCSGFFEKKDNIFSFTKFREKFYLKEFSKNLKSPSNAVEIKENEILNKYRDNFKVISKQEANFFSEKLLKDGNFKIIELDHKELEFLKLKGLLDENLIKPLYLG